MPMLTAEITSTRAKPSMILARKRSVGSQENNDFKRTLPGMPPPNSKPSPTQIPTPVPSQVPSQVPTQAKPEGAGPRLDGTQARPEWIRLRKFAEASGLPHSFNIEGRAEDVSASQ